MLKEPSAWGTPIIKANKHIEKLNPYQITSQDPWLFTEKKDIQKLDWNEGNFIPNFLKKEISNLLQKDYIFNWYSDYTSYDLHKALSEHLGISMNSILSFPGSDVALETICRCFIEPDDYVLTPTPTYENFAVFAESCGAKIINHDLKSPYKIILKDLDGTIAIEWGAYGVPETFLIHNKKIVKKIIGPLNENSILEIKEIIKWNFLNTY